jgi:hypothetical protein
MARRRYGWHWRVPPNRAMAQPPAAGYASAAGEAWVKAMALVNGLLSQIIGNPAAEDLGRICEPEVAKALGALRDSLRARILV